MQENPHFFTLISTLIPLASLGQSKATAAAHLHLASPPSCMSCLLDVFLSPLSCRMHAFKGTTEQIRGPSLCLSFQMEIEGQVYPWGITGASVAPAAWRPLCFHCVGAGL